MSLDTSADESAEYADQQSITDTSPAIDAALAAGESVLSQRFGSAIGLVEPEDLAGTGPATVLRARVTSSSFDLPRTIVVKHYPDQPEEGAPDPFAREAVSYQLFNALPPEDRMCPELLAHDGNRRVLVIDDLGKPPTLEDTLRDSDARTAELALLSWSRALGRLHATTAGREADFNALLRRLGGNNASSGNDSDLFVACAQLPVLLEETLGVATSERIRASVEQAAERLQNAGCRAFTPVQLLPDNNLMTDAGLRFLDFEHGQVRSALLDAGHLWAPFVSSPDALALPDGMGESMVAAWRAEVLPVWPALGDDEVFYGHLFDSQLTLVWLNTWRILPDLAAMRAARRGEAAAAVLRRWRQLAEDAERAGAAEMSEHAERVAAAVEKTFGPGLTLPLYPAFRGSSS